LDAVLEAVQLPVEFNGRWGIKLERPTVWKFGSGKKISFIFLFAPMACEKIFFILLQ
jgi:hypothetical protein